jgi:hypothetical protein
VNPPARIVVVAGGEAAPPPFGGGAAGAPTAAAPHVPTLVPPTERPEPRPTDPPVTDTPPPGPTLPPATATSEPTTLPTDPPTPTVIPANQPPVIVAAWCVPNPVEVYSYAQCSLEVRDPDNALEDLSYAWSADLGEMIRANTRQSVYYASFNSGMKEMTTWVTARASDPDGAVGELRFLLTVVAGGQDGAKPSMRAGGP